MRAAWAEAARRLAEHGQNARAWPDLANEGHQDLAWWKPV